MRLEIQVSALTIFFLVCFTNANGNGIVADLEKKVETLTAQLATSNFMLAQMYKELSAMKADTTQIKALAQLNQADINNKQETDGLKVSAIMFSHPTVYNFKNVIIHN